MHWSHFSIRSIFVLTTVVAGGTAVALSLGPGPACAYGLFASAISAHILAVRIGHAVSGHHVVRTGDSFAMRHARPDATRIGVTGYHARHPEARRVRQAGVAGVAIGSALGLLVIVPWFGWTVHPVAVVATGCSGASLGGLMAMSIVGVCDFFGNLKKTH